MKKINFSNKKSSGFVKNGGFVKSGGLPKNSGFVKNNGSVQNNARAKNSGVTMIELLIVVAILGILLFLLIFTTFRQVSKGRDGKRKADLEKVKIAFEDYFNDNNCYPNPDDWESYECDSDDFKPYLNTIPCDPLTKDLYVYIPSDDGVCNGYRMLARLENSDDPSVAGVGCDPTTGCGYVGDANYNYGVAQGTTVYVGEGGGGGGEGGSYSPDDWSDNYYCAPEFSNPPDYPDGPGCTFFAAWNAQNRNCYPFDGETQAAGLAACQAVCVPGNTDIMCDEL